MKDPSANLKYSADPDLTGVLLRIEVAIVISIVVFASQALSCTLYLTDFHIRFAKLVISTTSRRLYSLRTIFACNSASLLAGASPLDFSLRISAARESVILERLSRVENGSSV